MTKIAEKAELEPAQTPRSWAGSVVWAAIVMALLLTLAVVANLAIGRVIHWEIVSGFALVGVVFLSIGRRYQTV